MLIDWFTVIAQILNFLLLVWLLKRFLYRPVLNAIDDREEKIHNQIEEAEDKMEAAEKAKCEYQNKNKAFDEQKESMLNEASEEASDKRKELIREARQEAEALRNRLEQSIQEEYKNLNSEIIARTQQEVFAISRKVLTDLASEDLESHMVQLFIRRLRSTEDDQRKQLTDMLRESSQDVLIRSAFELSQAQKEVVIDTLEEITEQEIACTFEEDPDKISGIALTAGGFKIGWSVSDYLGTLEKKLSELIYDEPSLAEESSYNSTTHESINE